MGFFLLILSEKYRRRATRWRGYANGNTTISQARTVGNTTAWGSYSGGSYGGLALNGNNTYGSYADPMDLGSGGGGNTGMYGGYNRGGAGGGMVKITANALALSGSITADGEGGSSGSGGTQDCSSSPGGCTLQQMTTWTSRT